MKKVFGKTMALCPQCLTKVEARIMEDDGRIFLDKFCLEHGKSQALICSDSRWYRESLFYVKPREAPRNIKIPDYQGCPESCGLCPLHKQHTCLPVIEITSHCNMNCPTCLKSWDNNFFMTLAEYSDIIDNLFHYENFISVINLSGGEPTLHPEIGEMLRIAKEKNVLQSTISTNGLRLLEDDKLRNQIKEYDALVALQFDGFSTAVYETIRGKDLLAKKMKLIELLEKEGILYSLVCTVVKGVNDHEITGICDHFFKSKAVSLMFQPITFTGDAGLVDHGAERITIPDIVRELEKSRFIQQGDFNPLPCSHPVCFALSYYFQLDDNEFLSMKKFLGKENYLDSICNRTLPGLDSASYGIIQERIYDFWSSSDQFNSNDKILHRIKNIIKELGQSNFSYQKAFEIGVKSMKAIFIHQFMDKETFDFSRIIKCCNHYPQTDGRLIPMCAQNVFFQKP